MTAEAPALDGVIVNEPSQWRSLWASTRAVVAKETRWRMRGRRAFAVVTVYVALTGLMVFAVYGLMYDRAATQEFFEVGGARADVVSGRVATQIGQAIFSVILVVQMLLTLMVAPALTSGAVSTEREKQTLELLISTPVSTLGMMVGKLISSLAFVLLLIAASLPLMSVAFVFGGVAPDDVLRAYVMLVAVAMGVGSIGLFLSALITRTQVATAVAYVIVMLLVVGSFVLYGYIAASWQARAFEEGRLANRPPEALLLLNPVVAVVDLGCTAIPESSGFTCSFISSLSGREVDFTNPPRDSFWPRSAVAFVVLGASLTLASTQLIVPSRRLRRRREEPPAGERSPDAEPATFE